MTEHEDGSPPTGGGPSPYPPYGAPPPPYGAPPPPAYPPPGSSQTTGYGYGYPRPGSTNGFAIAALCCSLGGILVWFVGPVLGIVFGAIGRRQCRDRPQEGAGLATAGLIIGIVLLLLQVVAVVGLVATGSSGGSDYTVRIAG